MSNMAHYYTAFFTFLYLVATCKPAAAQKYYFQNYNVEHGLIQSQALDICQDEVGHLWIATLGGVSRFDGKNFTGYTKRSGLANNHVQVISYNNGYIWCGTKSGLSRFNGKEFHNLSFTKDPTQNFVTDIVAADSSKMYCIVSGKIYSVISSLTYQQIDQPEKTFFTSLAIDSVGILWAGTADGQLYQFRQKKRPASIYVFAEKQLVITKLFAVGSNRLLIGTNNGLYSFKEGKATEFLLPSNNVFVLDIHRDKEQNLWIASTRGCYFISADHRIHYAAANGLSDDPITCLLNDKESNTWMGSGGGNGFYRYKNNFFHRLDESSGLSNPSVVSFTKDKNGLLWMGTYGGGLYSFQNGNTRSYTLPDKSPLASIINSCVTDKSGTIWIGTSGAGLWQYDGLKFTQLSPSISKIPSPNIIHLYRDNDDRIWIGTATGAVVYENGKFRSIEDAPFLFSAFFQAGKDSILAGSASGLKLFSNGKTISFTQNPLLVNSDIKCFTQKGNEIWMGTTDNGIIIWDIGSNKVSSINSTNGLASEFIYSLVSDDVGNIFAGTGRGVHKISQDADKKYNIRKFGSSDGLLGLENNQNAVFREMDGSIWFGTSKGAFRYNPGSEVKDSFNAQIVLLDISSFGKQITDKKYFHDSDNWYGIPRQLKLPRRQNNVSFVFQAVSFLYADKIMYQYKMEGLETEWSAPSGNNSVTYTSLPSGKYDFKVRAIADNGHQSPQILSYSFEIKTPFYKTTWFQFLSAIFLIICGISIQYIRNAWKQKRSRMVEQLRQEEQNKIRQKTAEDFHDEMGNKLTRISLLADIVKSKLETEKPGIKDIAEQIKENSMQLYSGTRDIIWSLNPASDNLFEVLQYIRDFGYEICQDTDIDFRFNGLSDEQKNIKLPIDYSRNIIMIVKEGLNNALKYSHCHQITISVTYLKNIEVHFLIKDDGKGFDRSETKKGHGIDNMSIRARRINANFEIDPVPGKGTTLRLNIKIPQKKG